MKQYHDLVKYVLENGTRKVNRTGVATLSCFSCFYKVDISESYPLITTKKIFFNSMLRELLWYLSGEEHIRNLRDHTKIWDAWADSEGRLETAYGRFWRRFPVPAKGLDMEAWSEKWINTDEHTGEKVFDQIAYIIDSLKEIKQNPASKAARRLVVSAWHPANAAESLLPPCHYTFCFYVAGDKLSCHLTQRSADIALGVPFNLACYSLLTMMLAKESGFLPGEFAHTLVDAHIYENHIEGLKTQLLRTPRELPKVKIADKPFAQLTFEDFELIGYDPHPVIKFEVAV
ncbi:MAG: thymidylate synthase [Spirochaetes bacterium]|nr:thymidylate synthase [Spirochaetota bacterium]